MPPLKLDKILKGRFAATREAKDCLGDAGMLAITYVVTLMKEAGGSAELPEILATLGVRGTGGEIIQEPAAAIQEPAIQGSAP